MTMLKRIVTGAVYVAVIVAFFALRAVDPRFFGILVYAFSLIGTYEMVHALAHERIGADGEVIPAVMPMSRAQKACVYGYAVLFTPA